MSMTEELLNLRKAKKKRKPVFRRQLSRQIKRLGSNWKRPRGLQSKLRLGKRGHPVKVSVGWGSPKQVRYMTPSGLVPHLVGNVVDLDHVKEGAGVVIMSTVGKKKQLAIIAEAQKRKLKILNYKDSEAYVKKVEEDMKQKKEKKTEAEKKKKEKKAEAEKKKKEKKAEAEKKKKKELAEKVEQVSDKEKEKKEQDKILTKKEFSDQ